MNKTHEFYIKTISPIHIGCDEVYEPTGFAIDEKSNQMVVFDSFTFISQLSKEDKEAFSDICSRGTVGSILEIYKFMRNRPVPGRRVEICKEFLMNYKKTLELPVNDERRIKQDLNNYQIPRTAFRSVDQRPYIPGSSIKGTLRTAYLNMIENREKLSSKGKARNAKDLEQKLMKYSCISDDPFRMVKVSDFVPVGEIKTRIVYGVNKKKSPSKRNAQGPPAIFEIILPSAVFRGTITVDTPMKDAGIIMPVAMEELLKSAVSFYLKEKTEEERILENIGIHFKHEITENSKNELTYLLRIGRHSGAEAVTIEGHRDIFIKGKGSNDGHTGTIATTIWLAAEMKSPSAGDALIPFGWANLSGITNELAKTFTASENEWQSKKDAIEKQEKLESERQKVLEIQAAEEERKKAVEEEERKKEEEKRKAELEAMTPEERDIAAFSEPRLSEQQVFGIFNRLDGFSPENKIKVATELKNYWIKNKKWEKKHCSEKQRLKVQKVEKLLN